MKHPAEMSKRVNYLNNLMLQLSRCSQHQSLSQLKLLIDDISHCIAEEYYPLLKEERHSDSFNFNQTLADLTQLLQLEVSHSRAA